MTFRNINLDDRSILIRALLVAEDVTKRMSRDADDVQVARAPKTTATTNDHTMVIDWSVSRGRCSREQQRKVRTRTTWVNDVS